MSLGKPRRYRAPKLLRVPEPDQTESPLRRRLPRGRSLLDFSEQRRGGGGTSLGV